MGLEALHGEGGRCEWWSGPRPQGGAGPSQRPAAGGKGIFAVHRHFYSSPALFRELTERGFGACGTARKDRRGIPTFIRHTGLKKGEIVSSVDDGVLSLKWRDKRDVTMLSTFHDAHMVEKTRRSKAVQGGVEEVQKPAVVEDYNQHMGGVDKSKNNNYADGVI